MVKLSLFSSESAKKKIKILGVFLVKKGSSGFKKIPKKGTNAYKDMFKKIKKII